MNPEAKLGFWSLVYLLRFQKYGDPVNAAKQADESLRCFERKAEELGVGVSDTKEHS